MTAGLLLAAGESRRFGPADKLLADLDGAPLVTHAASALREAGLAPLFAVVTSEAVAELLDAFTLIRLAPGPAAQSRSLVAGVLEVEKHDVPRLAVTLGDMPRVTPDLIRDVIALCNNGGASAASDGTRPMPPACFDRARFPDLARMTGDKGAAPILRALPPERMVTAQPALLVDIDRPKDLAALRA